MVTLTSTRSKSVLSFTAQNFMVDIAIKLTLIKSTLFMKYLTLKNLFWCVCSLNCSNQRWIQESVTAKNA